MGHNTAPTDDDGKDLEPDKTNNKNKEEVENSGEKDEDEDGSSEINSEFKYNDDQESYFNNGTEEATIMGADTEVTNVEVPSSGHNNADGSDQKVGENQNQIKSRRKKAQISRNK